MSDFAVNFDPERMTGDLVFGEDDFGVDDGINTSIDLSLFIHRRAEPEEMVGRRDQDPRGHWGEQFRGSKNFRRGSKWWLLEHRDNSEETRLDAISYGEEALAWLIEDGVAESVTINAWWVSRNRLDVLVVVKRPSGETIKRKYFLVWNSTAKAS